MADNPSEDTTSKEEAERDLDALQQRVDRRRESLRRSRAKRDPVSLAESLKALLAELRLERRSPPKS